MAWKRIAFAVFSYLISAGVLGGAQNINGKIHDLDGRALKDVVVTAPDLGLKTYSDAQGAFVLELTSAGGAVSLRFETPGYYAESITYETKQPVPVDVTLTPRTIVKAEVHVVGSRLDTPLLTTPAATAVVGADMLEAMPRAIAIDEPLKPVAGVKVDNQANGERVHLSIRGQGILSERGIRGIQLLYDGIPLNDPSGFCPDAYDVDWAGVDEVNVVRGPVAFLYGGGSSAGVIDIHTRSTDYGFHGGLLAEGGSNAFYKTRGEISGRGAGISYLVSGSRTAGDGYRIHQAFWGNNVYGRFGIRPHRRLHVNPFVMATGFFNENSEGLNLNWGYPGDKWWTMPNPDAVTFNEYQRTYRNTEGFTGNWEVNDSQRVSFTYYTRHTNYKEPVPSSVEHRDIVATGGSMQYEVDTGTGDVQNHFSGGFDLDGQWVDDLRHPNAGNAVETAELLANQSMTQHRAGFYATDRISIGKRWTVLGGVRFDRIGNSVADHLKTGGLDLSGDQTFQKATGRIGLTWSTGRDAALFASWGQGFIPPATEELYANPAALGGFNRSLAPATSNGFELGARGRRGARVVWELEAFRLDTKNDFERYRIDTRPLETFYGNAGETRRYGFESEIKWLPLRQVTITGAYTYSHFDYTSYASKTYTGNLVGHRLPNSPGSQLFVKAAFEVARGWFVDVSTDAYSRAYIDPTNKTWIDGYGLLNARFSKTWQRRSYYGTFFIQTKNLTGKRYIAFTEPDPDGNSYQPGPNREVFAGMMFRF